VPLRVTRSPKG